MNRGMARYKQKCTHVLRELIPILVPPKVGGAMTRFATPTEAAWYCKRCGAIGQVMRHYRRPRIKWEKTWHEQRGAQ
jgi:hypothetical protein